MFNKVMFPFVANVTLTAVMELVLVSAFDVPHQITPLGICFTTNNTLMPQCTSNAVVIICITINLG